MNKNILIGIFALMMSLFLASMSVNAVTAGAMNVSASIAYEVGGQTFIDDPVFNATRQNLTLTLTTNRNATGVTCNYRTATSGAWTKFYENDTDNIPAGATAWKCLLDPVNWTITDSTLYFNVTANNTPTLVGSFSSNSTIAEMEYDSTAPTSNTAQTDTTASGDLAGVTIQVNDGSSTNCRFGTTNVAYVSLTNVFEKFLTNSTRSTDYTFEKGDTTFYIRCSDDHNNFESTSKTVTITRSSPAGSVIPTVLAVQTIQNKGNVIPVTGQPMVKPKGISQQNMNYLLWGGGIIVVLGGLYLLSKGKKGRRR